MTISETAGFRTSRWGGISRSGYGHPASRFGVRCCGVVITCCVLAVPAIAQRQQQQVEDPEDDHGIGLWLDQGISAPLSPKSSLEFEFHERFDEGVTQLYEYFFQAGVAYRPRSWLTLIPIYRYQRYPPGTTTTYESRVQFNLTLSTTRGRWRPNLRTLTEGRFPQNRIGSLRLRFRPGIDYTLPLRMNRPPVLVVSNEFFVVPGPNSFANGGSFTQNRFQVGIRLPMTRSCSIRPYFLLQSVNLPAGWETNRIAGLSLGFKF